MKTFRGIEAATYVTAYVVTEPSDPSPRRATVIPEHLARLTIVERGKLVEPREVYARIVQKTFAPLPAREYDTLDGRKVLVF